MNTKPRLRQILSLMVLAGVVTPAVAQESMMKKDDHTMMQKSGMMSDKMEKKVGLDGYCPVCIIKAEKWEKGSPDIASTFDGVTYYFPSEEIRATFEEAPEKYVPALNGDCIVCYERAGKRIPGSVKFAALRNERLYLFPSEKEKAVFREEPSLYDNTDLAANGECIVCLVKMEKHVPGSVDHTVIHDGLRYLFPSDREAAMFRDAPQDFVEKQKMQDAVSMNSPAGEAVKLVGRSGCAACEFGIKPIGTPDELGLAVIGADGRVTVVEGAHEKYPEIYKARFDGKQLAVVGKIIKTEGKFSWLQPTSVIVMN